VRYRIRDLPAILRNPLGAKVVSRGAANLAWPLLRPAAWLYRRTLLRSTRVIAVTGSFGKTTTCRAIATALDSSVPDGANHRSGIALRLLRTESSAPYRVVEVAIDGPNQMRGFARMVRPHIAVLCGIGSEHSRSMGTLERTRDEKAELLASLDQGGLAIINADNALAVTARERTRSRVALCGFADAADVRAEECSPDWPRGTIVQASVRGRRVRVRTRLAGRHMAFPILAALTVADELGIELEVAAERLAALQPTPGRMQLVELDNGVVFLNDTFKGSFESFVAAIDAAAELPARRRLLILGDIAEPPGKQSQAYQILGERLARVENAHIIHIGRERQKLGAGARKAGVPADRIVHLGRDAVAATEQVRGMVQPGDLVLLKGRDWQKLERILLALQGVTVRCTIQFCDKRGLGCMDCPLLETGWEGLPEFMDRTAW
jgi:UDP-N-acetylmuramoyl-tripeptide--D-alanyl-D-alanine ligase